MSQTQQRSVASIDPTTDEVIAQYPIASASAIDAALRRTKLAQRRWRVMPHAERGVAVRAVADELKRRRDDGAALITAEMGKTSREALAEIDKSIWACEYYAEHAEGHLAPQPIDTEWRATYVQFEPLGVVLAVMPWNYPVWQVFRAGIPALMAGNTVVLKHASNVTGSALFVESVFATAVPDLRVFEVVVVPGGEVAALIADDRIAAVTLTGSESVGVRVATECAKHLKKSVLAARRQRSFHRARGCRSGHHRRGGSERTFPRCGAGRHRIETVHHCPRLDRRLVRRGVRGPRGGAAHGRSAD